MRRSVFASAIALTIVTFVPAFGAAAVAAETPASPPPTTATSAASSSSIVSSTTIQTTSTSSGVNTASTTGASAPQTTESAAADAPTGVPSTTRPPTRHGGASAHATTSTLVTIKSNSPGCATFCFSPAQLTVAVGDTVTWTNQSGADHTVERCTPANCNGASGGTGTDSKFASGAVAVPTGTSFRYTFTQPGTYVYFCSIHGYALMHGTITVTAAPATTAVAATVPPVTDPGPTVPVSPQLAHTGGNTNGSLTLAAILIVLGLTATTFQLRRRLS